MPEITGVDQEPPNDERQDLNNPDDNQNDNVINYGTEEIDDPTEETLQINDNLLPQEKEPAQPRHPSPRHLALNTPQETCQPHNTVICWE